MEFSLKNIVKKKGERVAVHYIASSTAVLTIGLIIIGSIALKTFKEMVPV
jgi:hypothetical protein